MIRKTVVWPPMLTPAISVVMWVWLIALPVQETVQVSDSAVDRIFSKWTSATRGCAVGVGARGMIVRE
jgi:hypothetical protein